MTYELAKRLKDAGFPQTVNPIRFFVGTEPYQMANIDAFDRLENITCAPTLSELIEACGDDFDLLRNYSTNLMVPDNWGVREKGKPLDNAFGSTPEEAVANLWLALKQ